MGDSAARSVNPAIQAGLAIRICRIRADAAAVHCTTNREDITLPRVAGGYLRIGDELRVPCFTPPIREYLCSRNSPQGKGRQLYFGRVGYVTQPRADKRNEYFIRAEVPESDLGVRFLHLPNDAVRDYFYCFASPHSGAAGPTLYEILRTSSTASPADLRLAYRVCRIELETAQAPRSETQRAERAFNLLAHPDLRSCYDALLQDPAAPALFPYGGFGQCVVSGDLGADGETFFVRNLLCYLPDQRQWQFRAPLRRIEYLNGYALYRDSRRKAELYIDPTLLPVGWDPTWKQWRHLVGTKIAVAGTFVESGRYRRLKGEWHLRKWEIALPSRLYVTLPADAEKSLLIARRAYRRFGEYRDAIEGIRMRLTREPLDERELEGLSRSLGIPADFEIAQFCWKPDYDPYFYQQLKRRSQNVFFFRDEYLFQLHHAMVAEVPQLVS